MALELQYLIRIQYDGPSGATPYRDSIENITFSKKEYVNCQMQCYIFNSLSGSQLIGESVNSFNSDLEF